MGNNVLPQEEIFTACGEVLDTILRPLHYKELTKRGLELLGIRYGIDFEKQAEDVREKMLVRQWHSKYFYVGHPYYMGAVRHWFLREILNAEPIIIPANVTYAINGAYEALMRPMKKKNPKASTETRNKAKAYGLVIEHIVSGWFKENWPTLFLPSSNYQQWNKISPDDFRLKINRKICEVDIFTTWKEKKTADLHIQCRLTDDGKNIEWVSMLTGNGYKNNLVPELGKSPLKTVVWLNCIVNKLDYELFKQAALGLSDEALLQLVA